MEQMIVNQAKQNEGIKKLKQANVKLIQKVNELKNYSREDNNIIIRGISLKQDENIR